MKHKSLFLFVTLFSLNNSIAQDTPLGNKIVGNGDAANYYIGHFAVPGSDGLDLHWYGGIRFGDTTSNSVMQITNGNVGIGAVTPSAKLDVRGLIKSYVPTQLGTTLNNFQLLNERAGTVGSNSMYNRLWSLRDLQGSNDWYGARLHDGISVDASFATPHVDTRTWWERDPLDNIQSWGNAGDTYMTINNGNVGIGTTAPSVTTHIEKSAPGIVDILRVRNYYSATSAAHGVSILLDGLYSQSKITSYENPQSTLGGNLQLQTYNNQGVLNTGILLDRSGNVGVGSVNPDSKLTVNGTIHSTEVKVTQTVPADYVFQKYYTGKSELKSDYTMPTLAEVESFTKINNHLPNVPSAKEMQQNGVLLGEMSNVLLQKIEELTLYVIEQNKKIEALEAKLSNK